MSEASINTTIFDSNKHYLNMFEHRDTTYRFAVPCGYASGLERSNWRFVRRMKIAVQAVKFRTFSRLSYRDEILDQEGPKSSHVKQMFNRLNTIRRREKRSKFDYVWRIDYGSLYERPHYHMLNTITIDWKLLERCWGQGYIWIKYVKSQEDAMEYVHKYMSKSANESQPVKRRYGCSRGIPPTPKSGYGRAVLINEDDYIEKVVEHNKSIGMSEAPKIVYKNTSWKPSIGLEVS